MEAFGWPIAVVILGVFFILVFKRSINDFIGRVKRVGPSGIRASTEAQKQSPVDTSPALDNLLESFGSIALKDQEKTIIQDLNTKGMKDSSDTAKLLVRHLAATQLALYFERLNWKIWGSQIQLLNELNSMGYPVSKQVLLPFYESASNRYPDVYRSYSFDDYLQYMIDNSLIVMDDKGYQISQFGREFLQFLAFTGRTGFRYY